MKEKRREEKIAVDVCTAAKHRKHSSIRRRNQTVEEKEKTVADVVTDCTEILIDSVSRVCKCVGRTFFRRCRVFAAILHVLAGQSLALDQFEQEIKLALIVQLRPRQLNVLSRFNFFSFFLHNCICLQFVLMAVYVNYTQRTLTFMRTFACHDEQNRR